nr:GNAT family N-acetyltransferase [Pseudomonas luteola]
MLIRQTELADLDGFYSLFVSVCAEGLYTHRQLPPARERILESLMQALAHGWPNQVIEHEGQIIGSGEIFPASVCGQTDRNDSVGFLGMQIHKAFRNEGFGTRLLGTLIESSRAFGFIALELDVYTSNRRAIHVYAAHGFEWQHDLPGRVIPDGRKDQPQRMRLELAR